MFMMQQEKVGICLFELPDKDQAVVQRVITFGASQGKPYILNSDADKAQVIITLDTIDVPENNAIIIRIGEPASLGCDLVLQRPLLVTRVMRSLDDANHLFRSRPTHSLEQTPNEIPNQPIENTETDIPTAPPDAKETRQEPSSKKTGSESPNQSQVPIENDPAENEYLYTALVVDDSASIRKQLEIELHAAQIGAEFAASGEEALEKSSQKQYDLVFLDIIMPGIDGYEVCRQMRSHKAMKKTPIIMLSGKTSPLDEVQGVIAGASTYLTKPVKHEQFQQTLKRVSKWLTNFACQTAATSS